MRVVRMYFRKMEVVFFFSIFLVFFVYFGYPLTLALLAQFKSFEPKRAPIVPTVTLVITVFNEEKRIRKKLENTILLDYPKDKLQIIVASDGSTDATRSIVEDFKDRGIELFDVKERKGKENAQKEALTLARGEIVVFSDVATIIESSGIREIVSNFADPKVGCVSSEDRVLKDGERGGGEGFYVTYEMWLRGLESAVNSVVGLSGSFFAARREVCEDFSPKMQSDFRTLLSSIRKGMRGISDPKTIGYYQDIKDKSQEFNRKVRTVVRGLTVFFNNLEFLNIFKFGMFSYQYFCHKLLRWLVPFFLIAAFISNGVLALHGRAYCFVFLCHLFFYGLALAGMTAGRKNRAFIIKIPHFFVVVNASILVAWIKFVSGERLTMWKPSVR
jgi:glycosyltransferase involved in cell wall biosynthesis